VVLTEVLVLVLWQNSLRVLTEHGVEVGLAVAEEIEGQPGWRGSL
jgi:hypothetical protein